MLRNYSLTRLWIAGCWLWALAGGTGARAAIWPDQIGDFKKVSSAPLAVADKALWDEYGLDKAEKAEYSAGSRQFTGTAWRLKDPTGAFAAFESSRPPDARLSKLTEVAVDAGNTVVFVFSNYLIRFDGWKPQLPEITGFLGRLPQLDQSPLPIRYLPGRGLVSGSERYLLGPAALDRFAPGLPLSVVAFSMGGEGQIAQYEMNGVRMQMAVFSYPTPQIAIQRLAGFEKLPGAMAKRAGPLVAVIPAPADPNAAERLLSAVKYRARITVDERVPNRRDNVGDLLVNIFALVGVILAVIIPAGVVFGLFRRYGWGSGREQMTVLHLGDRSRE